MRKKSEEEGEVCASNGEVARRWLFGDIVPL